MGSCVGSLGLHVLAELFGDGSNLLHEFDDIQLHLLEEDAEVGVGHDDLIIERVP